MALPNEDTQQFSGLCALWSGLTDLGLHADAERHMSQAVDIARRLAGSQPGAQGQALLGASLYDLAGSLVSLGRPADALAHLQHSEAIYRRLEGSPGELEDGGPLQIWLADVLALRGQINHASGQRATAVMDLDEAVTRCLAAPQAQHAARGFTDVARILAINARVLADSGDSDLALTSAGWAYRLFAAARGSGHTGPAHTEFWALAASILIEIHAAAGRKALVENAARHAVEFERSRYAQGQVDEGPLAKALVRQAMVLSGKDALAARAMQEAHKLSQRAAAQTELAMRDGPRHYVSLAAALNVARGALGPDKPLPDAATVTRSPLEADAPLEPAGEPAAELSQAWLTPSGRLTRLGPIATATCVNLAQAGCELIATHLPEGLRLTLEACYGFAAAAQLPGTTPWGEPGTLTEVGPFWGQALLASSRACEAAGDAPMALDLATWAAALAQRLLDIPIHSALAGELLEEHKRLSGGAEPPAAAPPVLEAVAQR